MKRVVGLVLIAALVVCLSACSIESVKSSEKNKPRDIVGRFEDAYREYRANEIRGKEKYNNKYVRVTAKINGMTSGGLANLTGGATRTMEEMIDGKRVFFYAEFESDQESRLKRCSVGDTITFTGKFYNGKLSDCEF